MGDRGLRSMKVFGSTKQSYLFQHLPRAKISWTLLTLRKLEGLQMLVESMLNVLLAYYAKSILFFKGHFQLIFCLLMVTNAQ